MIIMSSRCMIHNINILCSYPPITLVYEKIKEIKLWTFDIKIFNKVLKT